MGSYSYYFMIEEVIKRYFSWVHDLSIFFLSVWFYFGSANISKDLNSVLVKIIIAKRYDLVIINIIFCIKFKASTASSSSYISL